MVGCLREVAIFLFLTKGDWSLGSEQGGMVLDLLFGGFEELVEIIGRDWLAEDNVDAEVGADAVICSPWRWAG